MGCRVKARHEQVCAESPHGRATQRRGRSPAATGSGSVLASGVAHAHRRCQTARFGQRRSLRVSDTPIKPSVKAQCKINTLQSTTSVFICSSVP